jgi:ketosteroid isomerase-like protein
VCSVGALGAGLSPGKEVQLMNDASSTFDEAIERSHRALDEIARGDPGPFFELYSDSAEATLANPYLPPACGRGEIEAAGRLGAANYREGRAIAFDNFAKVLTGDIGYTLEIERFEAKVAGGDEIRPVALRVTSIYRSEDGGWRLLHRHADPITVPQPMDSVLRTD